MSAAIATICALVCVGCTYIIVSTMDAYREALLISAAECREIEDRIRVMLREARHGSTEEGL